MPRGQRGNTQKEIRGKKGEPKEKGGNGVIPRNTSATEKKDQAKTWKRSKTPQVLPNPKKPRLLNGKLNAKGTRKEKKTGPGWEFAKVQEGIVENKQNVTQGEPMSKDS